MWRFSLGFLLALGLSAQAPRPVLVELFTSEGCSSCPPSDEVLRQLEAQSPPGVEVIALGLHVDYWDHLGWKDRFSDAAFTARQTVYAHAFHQSSVYTPEMVVDGRVGFVGSTEGTVLEVIREAAKQPTVPIELKVNDGALNIHLPDLSALQGAKLWLAITEDGLSSVVQSGENGGRRLLHAAVTRRLQALGIPRDATLPLEFPSAWHRHHLHAVVFAQDEASLVILGAASIALK
ncbi:MAG TPA: DUF1223 domain-containing protein [Holophagaceae bacterium]|nr:DUF1223 domain-containing protein [Holophagaceae bacterium]